MQYFTAIADKNVNIQNENEINEYIIQHMQEIVAHNLLMILLIFKHLKTNETNTNKTKHRKEK